MAQTNLIGKNILGYTVSEKIDSGAFGTVYKAIKTNAAGQYVRALKHITIPTEKQYNSVLNSMGGDVAKADSYFSLMLNNIVSEIRILNDLSEKGVQHIVRYYENDILVSDSPRRYDIFILMEHLTPLEEFIKSKNFLVRDVMKLAMDVLYGLQACHNNGVIHRDIKDDNIFVSDAGDYRIGDFGVSKIVKGSAKAESVKGTPNFLAPEVYLGKGSYTKSVDLYSLGILLYRLLNYNRNPFLPRFPEQYYDHDEDAAFEKRMSGELPDPPALGGEAIGRVIVKALSNSAERFQTADEFITALNTAIDSTPPELLDERIKFDTPSGQQPLSEAKQYAATLGETLSEPASEENLEDEHYSATINKHLFDTVFVNLQSNQTAGVDESILLACAKKNISAAKTPQNPVLHNNENAHQVKRKQIKSEEEPILFEKSDYNTPQILHNKNISFNKTKTETKEPFYYFGNNKAKKMFSELPEIIRIPDRTDIILTNAFRRVTIGHTVTVEEIIVPEGVFEIQDEAFNFIKIKKFISLPDTLTQIGKNAFSLVGNAYVICGIGTVAYRYCKDHGIRNSVDIEMWKQYRRCQYCGGELSFIFHKCKNCGRHKDY